MKDLPVRMYPVSALFPPTGVIVRLVLGLYLWIAPANPEGATNVYQFLDSKYSDLLVSYDILYRLGNKMTVYNKQNVQSEGCP